MRALPLLAASFAIATIAGEARAEDAEELEHEDGASGCRALDLKNERELELYERRQPATPYRYPGRPDTVVHAPWGAFFTGVASSGTLLLSTVLPHVGAQYRGGKPEITVSWPWSVLVIGPKYACTRKQGSYVVDGHRVHRILVEPSINSAGSGAGFSVRPGYRFIWHPTSWPIGPGLGLGSTLELFEKGEPSRYSISPEAVAHIGNCCGPSYFTFAVRYDHFFAGKNVDIVGGSLGYTFF